LDKVARQLGLETVPKKDDKFAFNIAGIDLLQIVPDFFKDLLRQVMGKKAATIEVNLLNSDNLSYQGPIYIGSNKQNLSVIYDTGSDYLVVQDGSCTNCVSKRFYTNSSTSYSLVNSTIIK